MSSKKVKLKRYIPSAGIATYYKVKVGNMVYILKYRLVWMGFTSELFTLIYSNNGLPKEFDIGNNRREAFTALRRLDRHIKK